MESEVTSPYLLKSTIGAYHEPFSFIPDLFFFNFSTRIILPSAHTLSSGLFTCDFPTKIFIEIWDVDGGEYADCDPLGYDTM
jgi:hypothetical protein